MSHQILGYTTGPVPATSAFTSAFAIPTPGPLQSTLNALDLDRRAMSTQPGMYIKHVPARFDALTGALLTGGSYLFSSRPACAAYADWTASVHDGGNFWHRPAFRDVRRWTWDVVGAHSFAPPARHALGRVQHFAYDGEGDAGGSAAVDEALRSAYPALRAAAESQGAAAFWLLHRPEERLVAVHLIADGAGGGLELEPVAAAREAVARLEALPSFGTRLPVATTTTFDRTSLFIQNWLPVSRLAGGVHQDTPNFPVLPQVTVEGE